MSEDEELFDAICRGDLEAVVERVRAAVDANGDVQKILTTTMIPAMREVGERFSCNEIFVPEMLVAARAMQGGIDIIEPILADTGHQPVAKICIGSVKGDLHDIGKNLVLMMLKGAGYEVEDLGVDCHVGKFETAIANGAQAVCLSALLTTTRVELQAVVDYFKDRSEVPIIVGGAMVTQEFADQIGAHGFGRDASEAVIAVNRCLGVA